MLPHILVEQILQKRSLLVSREIGKMNHDGEKYSNKEHWSLRYSKILKIPYSQASPKTTSCLSESLEDMNCL